MSEGLSDAERAARRALRLEIVKTLLGAGRDRVMERAREIEKWVLDGTPEDEAAPKP